MKIAIIAGSNRRASSSTRLARYVGRRLTDMGHTVETVDLRATPVPLYSPDDEEETDHVRLLRRAVSEADAVVLATPEYHGSLSGVLKNALDYLGADEFDGKLVLPISSAGGAVGVSSLQQLQAIVRYVHGINSPEWISIGGDQRQFDENGEPALPAVRARVDRVLGRFVDWAEKLRGGKLSGAEV